LVALSRRHAAREVARRNAVKIRGLSYRECSRRCFCRCRNIRPPVGFKFHAVLVVNSAHLASISSPTVIVAADFLGRSIIQEFAGPEKQEGDWTMSVDDRCSPAHQAPSGVYRGWTTGTKRLRCVRRARGISATGGVRDFLPLRARRFSRHRPPRRFRGEQLAHAPANRLAASEPIIRSLAYALLDRRRGEPSKERSDVTSMAAQSELVKKSGDWLDGKLDPAATSKC